MVKPTLRHVLGMGTLLLIALATVWALRPAPLAVETTLATRGDLTATVVAEGRVRVKDVYVVAAPVDGDLERIAVEPGDTVRPGAPVARIWPIAPRPLDARSRAEAEASLAETRRLLQREIATPIRPLGRFWRAEAYHQDYYVKNPVQYRFYRWRCGRDQRVREVWGDQ